MFHVVLGNQKNWGPMVPGLYSANERNFFSVSCSMLFAMAVPRIHTVHGTKFNGHPCGMDTMDSSFTGSLSATAP